MRRWAALLISFFASWVFVPEGVCARGVVIDQIEIEGVKFFEADEIQNHLEVNVGDELDKAAVVRTVRNFQALYVRHGYRDVQVGSRVARVRDGRKQIQTVLKFSVTEGHPTRVSSIDLVSVSSGDGRYEKEWTEIRSRVLERIEIEPGDLLNQDRLADSKRRAESFLEAQGFVGARIQNMDLKKSSPHGLQEERTSPADWVSVVLEMDLGDRVSFGFRGNDRLTRNELMAVIEDQKAIGLGKDYVQEIRAKVIDKYRSLGFAHAEVEVYTFERPNSRERRVTYAIREGHRVTLDRISFDGNQAFSADDLEDAFYEQAPLLVDRGYYVEKDVETAADLLIDWLKSKGYLSAKLITISRNYVREGRGAQVSIFLYEGEQTTVRQLLLEGVTVFSEEEVQDILETRPDEPLNLFAFSEGLQILKEAYREKGYLDAAVANEGEDSVVQYFHRNRVAEILLEVEEGPVARVGDIVIDGLVETKPFVVTRELQFEVGDVLEAWKVRESEVRLRRLGIFASVSISYRSDPANPAQKIVQVNVSEGTPGIYSLGLGFRNDLGVRAFGEVSYSNLWDRNHRASFGFSANRRFEFYRFGEGELTLGYVWPYFLIPGMTLRPSLILERRQYIQFDADKLASNLTLERRLLNRIDLTAALTYSLERTIQRNAKFEVDNETLTIGALIPKLRLDLRDDPLAPTRGFYAVATYEHAAPWLYSQTLPVEVAYQRAEFRADGIIPLGKDFTWYLSFRTGVERNLVDPNQYSDANDQAKVGIPLIKQFALGGVGSMRGYALQELNAQDITIQGTLSYVNYRTQLDFPLAGAMKIGPFLDAGQLHVDRYSLGGLRYGYGVGLHYVTPVGPVNFDWGFKVDPRPGEETNRFHFSIGLL